MAWYESKKKNAEGTTVVANPSGTATDQLNKLQVGTDIYAINSGASALNDLSDVNINYGTLGTLNVLQYDAAYAKWSNAEIPRNLANQGDVALSSPTNGQVLTFNSTTNKWENANGGGGSQEITPISTVDYSNLTPQQKSNGQVYLVSPASSFSPDYTASNWSLYSQIDSAYHAEINNGQLEFVILSGGGDWNSYARATYKVGVDLTNVESIVVNTTITYLGAEREIQIGLTDTLPGNYSMPELNPNESLETSSSWTLPIGKAIELDTSALTGTYYLTIKANGKTSFTVDSIAFNVDIGNIPNEIYHMNKKFSQYPGASGGSGHTILNDSGTALAQESNLQFKGTYTHDDSINEATVVEISRSMTKAEYDNLTEEEKIGIIEITDEDDVKICYDIEDVLRAGEDRITFSHEAINDNSTLDIYTNEVEVSPVGAFLSVNTSYTKATIEVVTTSVSGDSASVSVTYKDEEGSTISTQSLTYDDVTGEENAYVLSNTLNDILEVFYDSDNLSWVVKALSLCDYNDAEYEAGDVISTWVYSQSVDMEIEQYSTVGSVTYIFPVQNHNVAVKLRITSRDCGPIDIAPHIVDYSTEEQNTGIRWIDGSYIYQKTINTGALLNGANLFAVSDLNIDKVIEIQGFGYSDDAQYCIPYFMGNFDYIITACYFPTTHQIRIEKGTALSAIVDSWVTIKYTKEN